MGEARVYTYRTFINLVTAFLQNELSVVLTLTGTYTKLFLRIDLTNFRKKKQITYKELGTKMASDFSEIVLETIRQRNNVFNILSKMVLTQIFIPSLSINQV